MRVRRAPAVLEVVDPLLAHVLVLDAAEVDPDVRVLVTEHRAERQELLAAELAPRALVGRQPFFPRFRLDRVRRRAEREDVDEHRLVVAAPVEAQEAGLGPPAVRDDRRAVLCPGPLDAAVDQLGQVADLLLGARVAIEVRLRGQHAAEQQRGIDGRQLGRAEALTVVHVQEVIVEAAIAAHAGLCGTHRRVREKAQRAQRPQPCLAARHEAPLGADHIGGQREADTGSAGERRRGIAVRREAVLLVRRVPEEAEGAPFEIVDDGIAVALGIVHAGALDDDAGEALFARTERWCARQQHRQPRQYVQARPQPA